MKSLDLFQLTNQVRAGKLRAHDVVKESLARINRSNSTLNAFISINSEAMKQAGELDARIARDRSEGFVVAAPG